MRRVAEVERELVSAKERADEYSRELERCREAKRQLERELLTGPPQPKGDTQLQELLDQAEARRGQAQSEVSEMQEKLRFYAQSQQEMEEDRKEVARLGEELRALRGENSELRRRPGTKEANKRIAELRKQIEELQECLRKRHPDSILALVKACEPGPEEKRELRELKQKVEDLQAQLEDRDALYDRRVRALRAQYDHMRHEYERRVERARVPGNTEEAEGEERTKDVRHYAAPDREAVLKARIQDLERQVEHTKSYYLSKLRKREPLVPPQPAKPVRGAAGGGGPGEQRALQVQLQQLQQQLLEREQRLAELQRLPPQGGHTSALNLRLFLASPEAPALLSMCAEQRCLAQALQQGRFGDVAKQVEQLLPTLRAAEAAASQRGAEGDRNFVGHEAMAGQHDVLGQEEDVLRLGAVPALPARAWGVWRNFAELIAVSARAGRSRELAENVVDWKLSLEAVLHRLLCSPAGSEDGSALGEIESLLPRLSLEGLREDLGDLGIAPGGVLREAEAHAGLDHRLPWSELLLVLSQLGLPDERLKGCQLAASPDFSLSMTELAQSLSGLPGSQRPEAGLLRALTRLRLAASNGRGHVLMQFLRQCDVECCGFVARGDFIEALQKVPGALSADDRSQLAAFFAPAGDPRAVFYPLLLQSTVPDMSEQALQGAAQRWAEPRQPDPALEQQAELEAALVQARAERSVLQERLKVQEARNAEHAHQVAELSSEVPVQVVRRLQGEVAMLESKVLEQQASLASGARKAEISLRAELDVKCHEVATLQRTLESRDLEVQRYQCELEAIIQELAMLRGSGA